MSEPLPRDWSEVVRRLLDDADLPATYGREVVDELAAHLEDRYLAELDAGRGEREAFELALAEVPDAKAFAGALPRRRRMGNKDGVVGSGRRGSLFADGAQDAYHAVRLLRDRPAFAAAAILTIALGIGANTAIFSVVYGVLLRPLPYDSPDRLVRIWRALPNIPDAPGPITDGDFEAFEQLSLLDQVAAYDQADVTVGLGGTTFPGRVRSARTTTNLPEVLGVRPLLGRWFEPRESGAQGNGAVVLGYAAWRRIFGGDPSALGQALVVDGTPEVVVGIMPAGFEFPARTELWLPRPIGSGLGIDFASLDVVGRLSAGADVQALRNALETLDGHERDGAGSASSLRTASFIDSMVDGVRGVLFAFTIAVGLVLLIACANVANLLLARMNARRREFAIRAALGAGRARLARQYLTESVLLSLLGGVVGVGIARVGTELLLAINPGNIPRVEEIRLGTPVLLFTFVLTIATGLAFGLAPALRSAATRAKDALGEAGAATGAGRSLPRRFAGELLAVAEISLTLVLLVGAGLLLNSFVRLSFVDLGFDATRLVVAGVQARTDAVTATANLALADLLDEVRAIPSVRHASLTSAAPPDGLMLDTELAIEGLAIADPEERPSASFMEVNTDYFDAMGIPIIEGRDFDADEVRAERAVAVVSESLARGYLEEGGVLGRRFFAIGKLWEVVGVAGDARQGDPRERPTPIVYWPRSVAISEMSAGTRSMRFIPSLTLLAQVDGSSDAAIAAMRERVQAHPSLELMRIDRIGDRLWQSLAQPRFYATVFLVVAAVALLLATVGIYGVLSYTVAQRTHDLGVRTALGAEPGDLVRLVLGRGLAVTLAGLTVGIVGSVALNRSLASLLYGVQATDLTTYVAVSILLGLVALVACYLPARRAIRIDPLEALRCR